MTKLTRAAGLALTLKTLVMTPFTL